jgi:hypothetical protein
MKKYSVGLLLCYLLFGCGKTSSNNSNSAYFLNTTIKGVAYSTSSVSTFVLSNQSGCVSNKNYNVTNMGQINVDAFYLDCYIKHYANNVDFLPTITTASKTTHKIYDAGLLLSGTGCNYDLIIGLVDNSIPSGSFNNTVLMSTGITNSITSATKLDSTAAYIRYLIKGNFSCKFKNTNNDSIPVTGQFAIPIKVAK